MIRKALYELEGTHARLKQEYEAEVSRLRAELDKARGGTAGSGGPANAPSPPSLPPPGIAPDGDRGGGRSYGQITSPPNGEPSRSAYPSGPNMPGSNSLIDRSQTRSVQPNSPPTLLSDLDPDNVSRELKKEGSDWFAIWSSSSKKILDVSLVHSLVHDTVVCCVKFSQDGKWLATGCNRTAQIYDTKTGAKTCVLLDESATRTGDLYIRSICFSPDGKFLATGAEDRQIRVSPSY